VNAPVAANPFPGLRPFREDEEYLFFGRESQVDAMVDKLAATHFLAVVGGSGSGKSSLVNCGLRPALHRGLMVRAGSAWRMAQFRPGGDPVQALAAALTADGLLYSGWRGEVPLQEVIATRLLASKRGLVDLWARARAPEGTNLLVVVDQFEELFRFRSLAGGGDVEQQAAQATAFVNLLLETLQHPDSRIHVVITMRSDFLGECARFYGLPEAINAGQYLVPRMTREERRAAIVGPVGVGGGEIDPVLLTRLLNDVGDNPDQLSILQHALHRTWGHWDEQRGRDGPLAAADYEACGTMARALDQHAESAWAQLHTMQQALCQKLFRALTDKGTDARGIRRPTALGHLCAIAEAREAEVRAVVDQFREPRLSFLMPPADEPMTAAAVVDISHESLMRVWQRLRGWSEQEAASAGHYRRLVQTAQLANAGQAELLRGAELERALDWLARDQPNSAWAEQYGGDFDAVSELLSRSRAERDAAARAQQARRQRGVVMVAVAMLTLMGVAAYMAYGEARVRDALGMAQVQASIARAAADEAELAKYQANEAQTKAEASALEARAAKAVAEQKTLDAQIDRGRALASAGIARQKEEMARRTQKTLEEEKAKFAELEARLNLVQTAQPYAPAPPLPPAPPPIDWSNLAPVAASARQTAPAPAPAPVPVPVLAEGVLNQSGRHPMAGWRQE